MHRALSSGSSPASASSASLLSPSPLAGGERGRVKLRHVWRTSVLSLNDLSSSRRPSRRLLPLATLYRISTSLLRTSSFSSTLSRCRFNLFFLLLIYLIDLVFLYVLCCSFDVKNSVSGFGNPDWKRTHEPASKTAVVISLLLQRGATLVGRTVMDELAFGLVYYYIY